MDHAPFSAHTQASTESQSQMWSHFLSLSQKVVTTQQLGKFNDHSHLNCVINHWIEFEDSNKKCPSAQSRRTKGRNWFLRKSFIGSRKFPSILQTKRRMENCKYGCMWVNNNKKKRYRLKNLSLNKFISFSFQFIWFIVQSHEISIAVCHFRHHLHEIQTLYILPQCI